MGGINLFGTDNVSLSYNLVPKGTSGNEDVKPYLTRHLKTEIEWLTLFVPKMLVWVTNWYQKVPAVMKTLNMS
jgi:hypothetical protein